MTLYPASYYNVRSSTKCVALPRCQQSISKHPAAFNSPLESFHDVVYDVVGIAQPCASYSTMCKLQYNVQTTVQCLQLHANCYSNSHTWFVAFVRSYNIKLAPALGPMVTEYLYSSSYITPVSEIPSATTSDFGVHDATTERLLALLNLARPPQRKICTCTETNATINYQAESKVDNHPWSTTTRKATLAKAGGCLSLANQDFAGGGGDLSS